MGRSPDAARQLASRARRRVRADPDAADPGAPADRRVVDAFLAASRGGEMGTLLNLLDPDVTMRIDAAAGPAGADAVAHFFAGRAQTAVPALIDGVLGLLVAPGGEPRVAVRLTVADGRITAVDAITDPLLLAELMVTPLPVE